MPVQQTETTRPWTFDARSGVVYGLVTTAWYAVPDVAERRGTRALLKTTCGVAGLALLLRTREGREAVEGVRKVRDVVRDAANGTGLADDAAAGPEVGAPADATGSTVHELTPVEMTPAGKATLAAGAAVVLGVTTVLAVVGEKAAYRWGERMRARGARAPHLRVGLALGAASVLLGGLVPGESHED